MNSCIESISSKLATVTSASVVSGQRTELALVRISPRNPTANPASSGAAVDPSRSAASA
jgi:hypothetical protein